jgi:hypothetical protein
MILEPPNTLLVRVLGGLSLHIAVKLILKKKSIFLFSGPCKEGEVLKQTVNSKKKLRVKCVQQDSVNQIIEGISVASNLCDRGFVFSQTSEVCLEVGASFGDSENLEGFLNEHFFGK